MRHVKTENASVSYDDSKAIRDKVFNAVVEFFCEYEVFTGEAICQSDVPQIEALNLLSDLADDIIKFKVTWKD